MTRRAIRIAAVGAAFVLLAVLAAHLPPARRAVLAYATGQIAQRFDLVVRAEGLTYNALTLRAGLSRVSVATASAAATPFLSADTIDVDLPWSAVFGAFTLDEVDIDRARVTVLHRADGSTNLPVSREAGGEPGALPIGRLRVTRLGVSVTSEPRDVVVEIPNLSLDAGPASGVIRLGGDGRLRLRDVRATLSEMNGGVSFDGRAVRLTKVTAEVDGVSVALDGTVGLLARVPGADIRFSGRADLPALVRWVTDASPFDGRLTVQGAIAGPFNAPTGTVQVSSPALTWRQVALSSVAASLSFDPARASVEVQASLASGRASGRGTREAASGETALRVDWTDLDTAALVRVLAPGTRPRPAARTGGTATATGVGTDLARWTLDASPRFRAQPASRGQLAIAGVSRVRVADGRWRIEGDHAMGGQPVRIALGGRLDTARPEASTLGGTLTVAGGNLPEIVRALGVSGLLDVPEGIAAEGTLDAEATLSGTFAAPAFQAAGEVHGLELRGVAGVSAGITAAGTAREIVAAARIRHRSGDAVATMTIRPRVGDLRAQVTGTLVDPGALFPDLAVGGIATFRFDGGGRFNRLEARGTVDVADARYDRVRLGPLAATVALDMSGVSAEVLAREFEARAQGRFGFSDRRATVDVQAPDVDLERLFASAGAEAPVAGRVGLAGRAEGAIDDWRQGTSSVTVTHLDGRFGNLPVRLAEPARLTFGGGVVDVVRLEALAGDARVSIGGRLPAFASSPAVPAAEALQALLIGDLAQVLDALRRTGRIDLTGLEGRGGLALRARVSGSAERPDLAADLDFGMGQVTWRDLPPITRVTLRARASDNAIDLLGATAEWQGSRMAAEGRLPLGLLGPHLPASIARALPPAGGPASLRLSAASITSRVVAPFVAEDALAQIEGNVEGSATLEADALSLDRLRGDVRLDRLEVRVAGLPVEQREPTRITIADGVARVAAWDWAGQGATIGVGGTVRLADGVAALQATGRIDLRLLTPFVRAAGVTTGGTLTPRIAIAGRLDDPQITGDMTITGGEIRVAAPRVVVADVTSAAVLAPRRIDITSLRGSINGGRLEGDGTLAYPAGGSVALRLGARASGMAVEFPEGLRSELDADLGLTIEESAPGPSGRVSGLVTITRSAYRDPLSVVTGLLGALRTRRLAAPEAAEAALADRLALDVRVVTDADLIVDNNLARLEMGGDLRLIGTAAAPTLSGRAELREGGQLFLGRNRYTVELGTIDFVNPDAIEPTMNIRAVTRAGGEPIVLTLTGTPDDPDVDLDAPENAQLGDADIASLLLTGRLLEQVPGAEGRIVAEQAIGFLSGDILGAASRVVGMDAIRLGGPDASRLSRDATALAADTDPTTRLTFSKAIGRAADVTWSQSLRRGDAQTWIVDYRLLRQANLRLVSNDETLRSYEFRHDVAFGGGGGQRPTEAARAARAAADVRVRAVTLGGPLVVGEPRLRAALSLEAGDRFDAGAWQRDRDRLSDVLRQAGHLEARITATRRDEGTGVALVYDVEPGPRTAVTVAGFALRRPVIDAIERAWTQSVFDGFLEQEAVEIVRRALSDQGHPAAEVSARVAREAATKTLAIAVTAGPRDVGASRPSAPASPPPAPSHVVGDVRVAGATRITADVVRDVAALARGDVATPKAVDAARQRVSAAYRRAGFAGARVAARTAPGVERVLDVELTIEEGPRQVVGDVVVRGNRGTDADVITRALALEIGDPLGTDAWIRARSRVFDTALFRRVDVRVEAIEGRPADRPDLPMRVVAEVEEWPAIRVRYGLQVSEVRPEQNLEGRELAPGLTADATRRTLFGRAVTLAGALEYQRRERLARVSLSAPTLFGWPVESILTTLKGREAEAASTFVTDISRLAWEQRARLGPVRLSYSYAFERNHTFDPAQAGDPLAFDVTVNIARVNGAAVYDTRDDVFDTSRGTLVSSSLEFAPSSLGSELRFVRHLAQAYHFRPWRGMVFASAARLGTVTPLGGQSLIPSERFYAGGSRTVRGAAEDGLGPVDFFDAPAGGGGLLVLNQEVRFPVFRWVHGVAFADAGNVFATPSAIDLRTLIGSYGAGLRIVTPLALVRVDYGRLVSPARPQAGSRWTFGIGHAF